MQYCPIIHINPSPSYHCLNQQNLKEYCLNQRRLRVNRAPPCVTARDINCAHAHSPHLVTTVNDVGSRSIHTKVKKYADRVNVLYDRNMGSEYQGRIDKLLLFLSFGGRGGSRYRHS